MTDKEKFIELLQSWGFKRDMGDAQYSSDRVYSLHDEERTVMIGEGNGYSGFYATFSFDHEGKFISHAICE